MSTEAGRANGSAVSGQRGAGADPAEVGEVMGQLMADLAATSGMLLTLVGVRIGLWESLDAGPASPSELACDSAEPTATISSPLGQAPAPVLKIGQQISVRHAFSSAES